MNNISWNNISSFPELPQSFLIMFMYKLNWSLVAKHNVYLQSPISHHVNEWDQISAFPDLPERFLELYEKNLNWKLVSKYNQNLDVGALGRFIYTVDWKTISRYQKLDYNTLEFYQSFVDWPTISQYQTLDETTISRFSGDIDWEILFRRSDIPLDLKKKYYDLFVQFYVTKHKSDAPSLYEAIKIN